MTLQLMITTLSIASQVSTCHHDVQLGWPSAGRWCVECKELLTTRYHSKGFSSYDEELAENYYLFIVDSSINVCCKTVEISDYHCPEAVVN